MCVAAEKAEAIAIFACPAHRPMPWTNSFDEWNMTKGSSYRKLSTQHTMLLNSSYPSLPSLLS